jgi:excisionase family DNA binding protein
MVTSKLCAFFEGRYMRIEPDWFLEHAKRPEDIALQNVIPLKQSKNHSSIELNKDQKRKPLKKISDLIENLSVAEAAEYLTLDRSYLYDEIKAGKLKCQHFGRRKVISLAALQEYIEAKTNEFRAGKKSN